MCGHLVHGQGLGIVESESEDNDPRPDAWCKECDEVLMQEGEWNDKSEAFANIQVLCANCYDEVRRRNLTTVDGIENGINKVWFLDNVMDLHDKHPVTFQIPGSDMRQGLGIGDRAKLIFVLPVQDGTGEYQGERMWVIVHRKDRIGYKGVLESEPVTTGSINRGDKVIFGAEHIIGITKANEQKSGGSEKVVEVKRNINSAQDENRKSN